MQWKIGEKWDVSREATIDFPASYKPQPKGIKTYSGILTVSRRNIQKEIYWKRWAKNPSQNSLKPAWRGLKRRIRRRKGRIIKKRLRRENGLIKISIRIKIKIAYWIRTFQSLNLRRQLSNNIKCSAWHKIITHSQYCWNTLKCSQTPSTGIPWRITL